MPPNERRHARTAMAGFRPHKPIQRDAFFAFSSAWPPIIEPRIEELPACSALPRAVPPQRRRLPSKVDLCDLADGLRAVGMVRSLQRLENKRKREICQTFWLTSSALISA